MSESQAEWEPMKVLEYTLRVSGDALMEGEFEPYASIFDLPHRITTFEGSRTLRNLDDLREVFASVRQHIQMHQITDLIRECVSAEFENPTTIKSAHTSRYLAGAQQIGQTSMAYGILELKGDRWLTTSSQYAVAEENLSRAMIISTNRATNENNKPSEDGF